MESPTRKPELHPPEQRLIGRPSAPQLVNPHLAPIAVHLRSDEAIQPGTIRLEAPAPQLHRPHRIGAPDGHDSTAGASLKGQRPPLGGGTPSRRRLDPVPT